MKLLPSRYLKQTKNVSFLYLVGSGVSHIGPKTGCCEVICHNPILASVGVTPNNRHNFFLPPPL